MTRTVATIAFGAALFAGLMVAVLLSLPACPFLAPLTNWGC